MTNAVIFARALADPTRWRIARLVMHEALCVCELADILGMPQSSVSSHVQVIRKAGLLESEKCEKWTYFRIEGKYLKLLGTLEKFFEETNEPEWERDAENAVARLKTREGSCCPGPQKLRPRNRLKSLTSNCS
jgi:ArsR family transcriptional regulator, arsenate/arsenite/antimonite-responsive transcriptional repressor